MMNHTSVKRLKTWCAEAGCTPRHAYNLAKRGEIRLVKAGRATFVDLGSADEMFRRNEIKQPERQAA